MATETKPCPACGWAAKFGDWDYIESSGGYGCDHANGERFCTSCSENWYRVGMESTHDYSWEGEETGYVGGPSKEDCPSCIEASEQSAVDAERERDDSARDRAEQQRIDEFLDRKRGVL